MGFQPRGGLEQRPAVFDGSDDLALVLQNAPESFEDQRMVIGE
jgi:hypothetical protein